MPACPSCHNEIAHGVGYCPHCGAGLDWGTPTVAPPPTPQQPIQAEAQQTALQVTPKKKSKNGLITIIVLGLLFLFCCICPTMFTIVDGVLRDIGVLPTYTPTPTDTTTPTITLTPTPRPTGTPIPTATLTPTPKPVGMATVTGDNVNVRTGPGTAYDVATKVSKGDELSVYARTEDGKWLQVSVDGGQWIAADLVKLDVSIEQVLIAKNIPSTPTIAPTNMNSPAVTLPIEEKKVETWKGVYIGMPADDVLEIHPKSEMVSNSEVLGTDSEGYVVKWIYSDAYLIMARWEQDGVYCYRVREIHLR